MIRLVTFSPPDDLPRIAVNSGRVASVQPMGATPEEGTMIRFSGAIGDFVRVSEAMNVVVARLSVRLMSYTPFRGFPKVAINPARVACIQPVEFSRGGKQRLGTAIRFSGLVNDLVEVIEPASMIIARFNNRLASFAALGERGPKLAVNPARVASIEPVGIDDLHGTVIRFSGVDGDFVQVAERLAVVAARLGRRTPGIAEPA